MLTLFRWSLRLTIGLIVGLALALAVTWYFAMRSLPDYDATHALSGISAPVEIVRSTVNIPHVLATSDSDAFFALGFAHAQDRLFQMTVLRRAAQGRLAEIYGERADMADDLARRLGFARLGQAALEHQDEATRAALSAYADGVNRWIETVNADALGRGAPEFFLLPGEIAYWQPADSLAILKLYAAASSRQVTAEVLRARLSLTWPERGMDLVAQLGEPPLPAYAELVPDGRLAGEDPSPTPPWALRQSGYLAPFAGLGAVAAAVEGPRTAAGQPLHAASLQQPLTMPGLWYLARLSLSSGDVIGATIPGLPAMFAGRSDRLAWGLVPAQIDDADLFVEEIQPGDDSRYRGVRGWEDLVTSTEIIRVRGAGERAITRRETANGVLLPAAHFDLATILPVGHAAALNWTGFAAEDRTMSALLGVMRASDRAQAVQALSGWVAPAVTAVLADADGVGQHLAGLMPVRDADHPTRGAMPVPGWIETAGWRGLTPLPSTALLARDDGLAFATGALAPHSSAATPTGHDGGLRLTQERLQRLLVTREIHSRDSMIEAQLDIVSPAARALLPLVGADLWFTGEPAAPGTPERQRQDALSLLAEWDGAMSEHLPEPLVYTAWMAALQQRLIRDDLGPLAAQITALQPGFIERVFRNRGGAAAWCDVRQSAPVETCTTIARQALDAALVELTARYGSDVNSWRWGDAHEAWHLHPALGIGRLGWITNLRQSLSGGDSTLAAAPVLSEPGAPFRTGFGSGYRAVTDLADPDSSVFVAAAGQSGHPLSRHYDDLSVLWRRGEYVAMSLDADLARAGAVGITRLEPAAAAVALSD